MFNALQGLTFGAVFSAEAVSSGATANSSSVDTLPGGDTLFLLIPTAIANVATVVKVQESDDDSTWSDVSGAALTTLPGNTDDGKLFGILVTRGKTAHKRYLRLVYTHGGSGSATLVALAIHDVRDVFPADGAAAGFDGSLVLS